MDVAGLEPGAERASDTWGVGGQVGAGEDSASAARGFLPCPTGYDYGYVCVEFALLEEAIGCMEANQGTLVIGGKDVTLEYTPCPEFWRCKRCKVCTVGYRSSCSYCKLPRDGSRPGAEPKGGTEEEEAHAEQDCITEAKLEEPELPGHPKPQKQPPQPVAAPQQSQAPEPEPRKREEGRERWPSQERRYPAWKESQEPAASAPQEGESRTIMLKRIPRFTPPEAIVGLLAPFVRLSTSSVSIIKKRASQRSDNYGFVELGSHAEAVQLVKVLQNLDPPICIDGHTVLVNLATGRRRNDYGEQGAKPYYSPGKRGVRDRRGTDSQRHSRAQSPSDVSTFIYDPDTGNYYDPIAGLYYDPKTQKEVPVGREAASSPTNGQGRRHGSQERTSERKEPSSRDRKERGRSTPAKTEFVEEKPLAEDVFKKPLPPMVKKEESSAPPKVVNPLIGLLGEYGGDSDNEEEEEEEAAALPPHRPPAPREEQPRRAASEQDKLTDWTKLACLLCRRQFPNKEVLLKHQQLSNLHKQNLEIHRKIKRSEQELAYLEKREREGKSQEKGNGRRERFQRLDSPERKRPKEAWDSESDQSPASKARIESNKGSRTSQAVGWKEGSGLGRQQQGMTSPVEAEGQKKGAGLGNQGKPSKRQSNETYRDAVRRVMFARYKELE